MKNFYYLAIALFLMTSAQLFSQKDIIVGQNSGESNFWQFTPRIGYDFPSYDEDYKHIKYEGGLNFGISVNKYWKNWGIQGDFDNIQNSPEFENLSDPVNVEYAFDNNGNLIAVTAPLGSAKDDITRMYFGIGPSYKYQSPSNRFTMDLAFTGGPGRVDGGEILAYTIYDSIPEGLITYHSGFNDSWVVSIRPSAKFNYYFNDAQTFGLHAGFYYLRHFGVSEGGSNSLLNQTWDGLDWPDGSLLCYYQDGTETFTTDGDNPSSVTYFSGDEENAEFRGEFPNGPFNPEKCKEIDVASFGIYGGVSFRLFPNNSDKKDPIKEDDSDDDMSNGACKLSITAKDKMSGKIMPNTDIMLVSGSGQVQETGQTNSYGVVVFDDVAEGSYTIKGKYSDVDLQEVMISSSEIADCKSQGGDGVLDKEILYTDDRFVINGKVVECNKADPIQGVDIMAKNTTVAEQLSTISDSKGMFAMQVNQATTYAIQGKKSGYFSNIQLVNTNDYNRSKDFEIKIQMCVDPCGVAIKLDNIQFDLDKANIKTESIPDLKYILRLMEENPNIIIEMSSHTDSRGSNEYNQKLSQRRAESTVNWLVQNGADRSRLKARGAGETELLNNCSDGVQCTEAQHAVNRRTEFKVECPN